MWCPEAPIDCVVLVSCQYSRKSPISDSLHWFVDARNPSPSVCQSVCRGDADRSCFRPLRNTPLPRTPVIYLRQRRRYNAIARDVCLSVCLSVSKITEKRVHTFGWNFACRQVSGHERTDQLLSPIRGKSESRSRSNRHLTQSRLQVTGCTAERYCLLHIVVQGRELPRSGQLLSTTYGCGATGR